MMNFLQVVIALFWMGGLNRFSGPLAPGLRADLLGFSLLLPPVVAVAHALGLPAAPEPLRLIHLESWVSAFLSLDPVLRIALLGLFCGTALIFVFQELIPVWQNRMPRLFELRRRNERLIEVLQTVRSGFEKVGIVHGRGRPLKIFLLETDEPVAALQGIVEPVLLISRGLMQKLDAKELEAVVAHEYAHFVYGGNLRLLWIWIVRSFQAFNPAALIVFRTLTEMRELSCDALAVSVTQKPATLSSAILKVYDSGELSEEERRGVLNRTKNELLRRAEAASIRIRVRTLLDYPGDRIAKAWQRWAGFIMMGVIVWAIG